MLPIEVVRLDGVTRHFAQGQGIVTALRQVDLEVADGECIAITGPSGSGKTTLLGLIGGIDRPDSGQVLVAGHDVGQLKGAALEAYRLRVVGFVFQNSGLLPLMSALENVVLTAALCGVEPGEARERAHEVLAQLGLAGRVDHRGYELSGGERQRVALARALVKRPRILLADEPTGQLDSSTAVEIIDLVRQLQGITVIVVTHDAALVEVADRSLQLEDGVLHGNRRVTP
ncbi:ABC transporter ATP-binding protein [Candidatus Dormiibacter inghamiae]|uniref:ABC transporter ATP-binding protein n=1 Tax=Candidatus Dormiibacter inghamiae TaxID=3127013 RepID=UPI0030C66E15